eukprot:TRINITY_DN5344_c0_g3_i1.p1 TRINITY_DN5344_c0_g3~~TRINITY_DN5344_c0_g3_i1.p1  ORF type:complete len:653 (-),score=168.99 TRINITY_DN5344_c0_g3_i1:220-2109(-)
MLGTPKVVRSRPSLGEPCRVASRSLRDQSPGGLSVGSVEEQLQQQSRGRAGSETFGAPSVERSLTIGLPNTRPSGLRPGANAGRNSRDPRPVGERTFAVQCARNVTEFLAMRGYPKHLSAEKFYRDPSTKEFFDIFKFLIMQLDPQLELEGSMEQEVPLVMRRLKYPVEVNKSKLQAISGPNTWPQLLAVLDWLVVLIRVHDDWIQPIATCQRTLGEVSNLDECDPQLLRSLHENYVQYLNGKDGREDEERLQQIFEERILALRGEIDRLSQQHTTMERQIGEYRSEHERLIELQNAPRQLEMEADRLRGIIQSHEVHVERLEDDTKTAETEGQGLQREIEGLQSQVRSLEEHLELQAYSKKDIERLKCERGQLRRMLDDLRADAEKAEHAAWELNMKESSRTEAIGRLLRQANDLAESVVPQTGSYTHDRVRVDLLEPTDALAALDFADERRQAADVVAKQAESVQAEEANLQDVVALQRSAQAELAERERDCQHLRLRLEQLERIREENRIWSVAQLDDAQRTAEETEDAVHEAARGCSGPTSRDQAEVDELRLALDALRTQGAEEIAQLRDCVRRDSERAREHSRAVQMELEGYADDVQALCKSVMEEAMSISTMNAGDVARRGGC